MTRWYEIGEGWTPAIRAACERRCAPDPPCFALGGQGLIGGDVEMIEPCSECEEENHHG